MTDPQICPDPSLHLDTWVKVNDAIEDDMLKAIDRCVGTIDFVLFADPRAKAIVANHLYDRYVRLPETSTNDKPTPSAEDNDVK